MTAAELIAQLQANPEFVARRAREEAERQKRAEEWRAAEAPLIAALKDVGISVDSVWDLVNSHEPYDRALPILVEHLQRSYPSRVREGIARALAVPESRSSWGVLVRLYSAEDAADAKNGLAAAISVAADDELLIEVIALLRDSRHGSSRLLLLGALEKSSSPSAGEALAELRADPDLKWEVEAILKRHQG